MNATLHRILVLIRKELIAVLKDPRSRIILIMPVILQSLLFGYAATFDLDEVPYALLDSDRSGASSDFMAYIDGSGVFQRVKNLGSAAEIPDVIGRKEALLVIHIPANFERDLLSGMGASMQAITDGRNSNTGGTAGAYVGLAVERFNAQWLAQHAGLRLPLTIETRAWYNANLETRWNMIPSLVAALSMLQVLMLTALSVAREREQGTFDQLLVTPLRPTEMGYSYARFSCRTKYSLRLLVSMTIELTAKLWGKATMDGSWGIISGRDPPSCTALAGRGLRFGGFLVSLWRGAL